MRNINNKFATQGLRLFRLLTILVKLLGYRVSLNVDLHNCGNLEPIDSQFSAMVIRSCTSLNL